MKYVDRDGKIPVLTGILIAGVIGIAVDLVLQTMGIVSVRNFGIGALTSFLNDYMANTDKDEMMEQINI